MTTVGFAVVETLLVDVEEHVAEEEHVLLPRELRFQTTHWAFAFLLHVHEELGARGGGVEDGGDLETT